MDAPKFIPRKHSILKLPVNKKETITKTIHAEREVELLNHCFADVEKLMSRLQQAANFQRAQEQSTKKKQTKKNRKKQEYDLKTEQANSPSELEFVDIFQKFKYSFSLLDRLKMDIARPNSEELLHHLFVPLTLMVKTTGGPNLAAGVSSPALTKGAISLLQENLTPEEMELWRSLGPNWTQSYSQHASPLTPYTPVFLDGWKPKASDANGHVFEDPVESQNKYDAFLEQQSSLPVESEHGYSSSPVSPQDQVDSVGPALFYRCSYDFVARNNSELSVLHGETLQVLDSSKRWWRCKNNYDQIGFVSSNILEPVNHTEQDSSTVMYKTPMKSPLSPQGAGRFSYVQSSPSEYYPVHTGSRPFSMPPIGSDGEKVLLINNELAQLLANGRPGKRRSLVNSKANNTSAPLYYHSSPDKVKEWLSAKGFNEDTVNSLGILTGAQLFSLNKDELCKVSPQEGARVYSQIMVQKAQLEAESKTTELEAVMTKQKMKVDPFIDGEAL